MIFSITLGFEQGLRSHPIPRNVNRGVYSRAGNQWCPHRRRDLHHLYESKQR